MSDSKNNLWITGQRIKIVVGHYGSGKTEIALNMARSVAQAGYPVTLVDVDVVNPFFRSAERGAWLAEHGIELIAPPYALTGVDIPALPAQVFSVFSRLERRAIFDVGGDDAGAVALGQYRAQFEASGYELLYVVNAFRPRSDNAEEVVEIIGRIARRSRLQPTGLINNANLAGETTAAELERGAALLHEVGARTGLPIVATCGIKRALDAFDCDTPKFAIERQLVPEWMDA